MKQPSDSPPDPRNPAVNDPPDPTVKPPIEVAPPQNPQGGASGGLPTEGLVKAPPPASEVVAKATKTEREAALERENEGLRKGLNEQQRKTAEHEDTSRGLTKPPTLPPVQAAKKKESFLAGTTLEGLDDDE